VIACIVRCNQHSQIVIEIAHLHTDRNTSRCLFHRWLFWNVRDQSRWSWSPSDCRASSWCSSDDRETSVDSCEYTPCPVTSPCTRLCSASSTPLSTWHCPHLLLSAGAAVRRCRSIFPAPTALSSKLAARRCRSRTTGQTDRRTHDRYVDPAPHTMQ